MRATCSACNHPGRQYIDEFCLNRKVTFSSGETAETCAELLSMLVRLYPDVKPPPESTISKHGAKHVVHSSNLQIVNGILCDSRGRALAGYGIIDTLRALINMGMINILQNPEKVGPNHLLEALGLLWKFQNGLQEQDEFSATWLDLLNKGEQKKQKGKRKVKNVTDEVDDEEAIEGEYRSA